MSNPYISKNQMQKIIVQQEGRLNAVMALLERVAQISMDAGGFGPITVENFSKGRPASELKMRIAYDEKTDVLELRVEKETVMYATGSGDTAEIVEASGL